jgi:hypothetical protein
MSPSQEVKKMENQNQAPQPPPTSAPEFKGRPQDQDPHQYDEPDLYLDEQDLYLEEGYIERIVERIVREHLKRVNEFHYGFAEPNKPDIPECFKIKAQIVRTVKKELEQRLKWLVSEYPAEAGVGRDWEVHKWMLRDPKIRSMLHRAKQFAPIYNHLWKNYVRFKESEELWSRVGKHRAVTGKGKEVKRHYVIVLPDYDLMTIELKISKSTIQKYLRAFCKFGVLKDLGKLGPNRQKAYAIGSWIEYGERQARRHKFLTKALSERLREFKVFEQEDEGKSQK